MSVFAGKKRQRQSQKLRLTLNICYIFSLGPWTERPKI